MNLSTLVTIARLYAALEELDRRAFDEVVAGRPRAVSPRGLDAVEGLLEDVLEEIDETGEDELVLEVEGLLDLVESEKLARKRQDAADDSGGART